MKIFQRDSKTNFVDVNNVLVGFDTSQFCCENYDWFISRDPKADSRDTNAQAPPQSELEEYVFDTSYFESRNASGEHESCGGMVTFRLTAFSGNYELFLHLYNYHNGYYSHGFSMSENEIVLHEGSL